MPACAQASPRARQNSARHFPMAAFQIARRRQPSSAHQRWSLKNHRRFSQTQISGGMWETCWLCSPASQTSTTSRSQPLSSNPPPPPTLSHSSENGSGIKTIRGLKIAHDCMNLSWTFSRAEPRVERRRREETDVLCTHSLDRVRNHSVRLGFGSRQAPSNHPRLFPSAGSIVPPAISKRDRGTQTTTAPWWQ